MFHSIDTIAGITELNESLHPFDSTIDLVERHAASDTVNLFKISSGQAISMPKLEVSKRERPE